MPAVPVNLDLTQPLIDALMQLAAAKAALAQVEATIGAARTNVEIAKAAVIAAVNQS